MCPSYLQTYESDNKLATEGICQRRVPEWAAWAAWAAAYSVHNIT